MSNITKTSLAPQFSNTIATDYFMEQLYSASLFAPDYFSTSGNPIPTAYLNDMRPKITDISKYVDRPYQKGDTIKVPYTVTAPEVMTKLDNVEGVDQAFGVETIDVTVADARYIQFLYEDIAQRFDNVELAKHMIREQAYALAQDFEQSILALFPFFTTTIGGGALDVLTADRLAEIRATFDENKIDTEKNPIYLIVNPRQYAFLINDGNYHQYQITGDGQNKTLNSGSIVQTPYGIRICRSPNVVTSQGVAAAGAITKEAIAVFFAIKPTMEKDHDSRKWGDRHKAFYMCGYAKMRDLAGISLVFDADPPL